MSEPLIDFLADDEEVTCPACMGSGFYSECFDDLCHGQEECIHGDDSTCRECNGLGYLAAPSGEPRE